MQRRNADSLLTSMNEIEIGFISTKHVAPGLVGTRVRGHHTVSGDDAVTKLFTFDRASLARAISAAIAQGGAGCIGLKNARISRIQATPTTRDQSSYRYHVEGIPVYSN